MYNQKSNEMSDSCHEQAKTAFFRYILTPFELIQLKNVKNSSF
ncbi:hypothetical protein LMxysn_1685 [Listeria monocytogenes]|nr:hypothetical protein LMxysn_1685 [Listeria monocytogenes]